MELLQLLPASKQLGIGILPAEEQEFQVETALKAYFDVYNLPGARPDTKREDIEAALATLRAFYKKKGQPYKPPSFDFPGESEYKFKDQELAKAYELKLKQEQEESEKARQAEEESKRAVDVKEHRASKKQGESRLNQSNGMGASQTQMQEKLEKYEADMLQFIEDKSQLSRQIEELKRDLTEAKQQLGECAEQNKELQSKRATAEAALQACRTDCAALARQLESEKTQANQKVSTADDGVKLLEKQNSEARQAIEKLQMQNKELQSSLGSVQEQIKQLKEENSACKEQKAALEAGKQESQSKILKAEARTQELQQTLKQLSGEVVKVRISLECFKSAIAKEIDSFQQGMAIETRITEDRVLTLLDKRRGSEIFKEDSRAKSQYTDGNEQSFLIKQLKDEVSRHQESVRQTTVALESEKEKARRLEISIKALEDKQEELENDKEDLEVQLNDLRHKLQLKDQYIRKADVQLSKLRASMFQSSGGSREAEDKGPLDPRMRYALGELYAVAAGEKAQESGIFEVLPETVYAMAEALRRRQLEHDDLTYQLQQQQADVQLRRELKKELKLEQNRCRELQAEVQACKAETQRERALKQEALGICSTDLLNASSGAPLPATKESTQALYAENAALTRKLVQLRKDIGEDPRELQAEARTQQTDPTSGALALSTGEQSQSRRYVKIAEFQQVQQSLLAKTAEAHALMELLQRRAAAEAVAAEAAAKRRSISGLEEPQDAAQQEIEKLQRSCAELRKRNAELLEALPAPPAGDYQNSPEKNPMMRQIIAENEDLRREINDKDDQLREVKKDAREQRRELQTQLSDAKRQLETARATSSAQAAQKKIADLELQIHSLQMLNQQLSERLGEQRSGIWGQKGQQDGQNAQLGSQRSQAELQNSARVQEELAFAKGELALVRNELQTAKMQEQSYISQLNDFQDAERLLQENLEFKEMIANQKKLEKRAQLLAKKQEEKIKKLEATSQEALSQLRELQELKALLDERVPGMQGSAEKLKSALANHASNDFVSLVVQMANSSVDVCKQIFACAADPMLKETVGEFGLYFGSVYQLASALLKGCAAEEVALRLRESQAQLRSRLIG